MRRVAAVLLILTSIGIFAYGSQAAIPAPEAKNMRLLGHHSLKRLRERRRGAGRPADF